MDPSEKNDRFLVGNASEASKRIAVLGVHYLQRGFFLPKCNELNVLSAVAEEQRLEIVIFLQTTHLETRTPCTIDPPPPQLAAVTLLCRLLRKTTVKTPWTVWNRHLHISAQANFSKSSYLLS